MLATIDREDREKSRFVQDTSTHEMEVLLDQGSYRHLLFRAADRSSFYWYELVTWPGHLTVNGDCGTYTFRRTDDMFSWFRRGPGEPEINPSYWAQKLQGDRGGREISRVYSYDRYLEQVEQWREEMAENILLDLPDPEDYAGSRRRQRRRHEEQRLLAPMHAAVDEQLLSPWGDERHSMDAAYTALRDFDFERSTYLELCEVDLRDFDGSFLWCCWAIVSGIAKYDASKAVA